MEDEPAEYRRTHRMETVLECGGHAEIPAAAMQAPEEVGVLAGAGRAQPPICGHDVHRKQVIAGQPEAAHEVAEAASEREPGDARGGDEAAGGGEAKGLRLVIELGPGNAPLGTYGARSRINPDALHGRQVDHQAAVAHGAAGDVVAAATDGDRQLQGPREGNGLDHVSDPGAAGDEGRSLVDHAVPDLSRCIVALVSRAEECAAQGRSELLYRRLANADIHRDRHGRHSFLGWWYDAEVRLPRSLHPF